MPSSARRVGRWLVASTTFTSLCIATWLAADDARQPGGPAAPTATPPEEAPPADPFTVPKESTPETVGNFVQNLVRSFQTRGAEFRSEEGTKGYLNKMDAALGELQGRQLDADPAVLVASVRMQVLNVLTQIGDATSAERTTALVKTLQGSSLPQLKDLADQFELQSQVQIVDTLPPEQRAALVQRIAAKLATGELSQEIVGLARESAEILEELETTQEAVAAYELYAKTLEGRKDERLASLIESFRGAARLAGLVGNVIDIKGTTIDGKSFDIAALKGKVVLVDFWATWCGPCIGELPNVRQAYDLYHAKGFEVVGISLDEEPDRLKEFLAQEQIPWTTLFPTDETQRGWENPLAKHYGISGIPTVILVDKAGKVVSLDARGPALGQLLAEQLGPAEPAAPPKEPAPQN